MLGTDAANEVRSGLADPSTAKQAGSSFLAPPQPEQLQLRESARGQSERSDRCGHPYRLTISDACSSSPASLVQCEQGVNLHDGANEGEKSSVNQVHPLRRDRDSQVVSEKDPTWHVDYMARIVPEMRQKLGGTRCRQPDSILERHSRLASRFTVGYASSH